MTREGGGGIISLPAYLFVGIPPHYALGSNKFSGSCGTTLAVYTFWKGGAIDLKAALIAATGSFFGAAIGSGIALKLNEQIIKTMLFIILPIVTVVIFTKRNFGEKDLSSTIVKRDSVILAFFIGFLIGGYDGMFGPGTGTFAIIAFSTLLKYDLKTAAGNAKILNLASNYASFATFALAGTVVYKIAIPAAVCGMIGNHFGSRCALRRGAKFIRPMMIGILTILLAKIAYDLFTA